MDKKHKRINKTAFYDGSNKDSEKDLQEIKLKLLEETKQLPIFKQRKKLQKMMKSVDRLVIIGETGSGKTTQVPKYMYQANINNHKCIAVTQPRRVAAITLATRVAKEMGCRLGDKVGYNVRFENMTQDNTSIIFMTDGMLLREALLDPLLSKYGMVILDEAHERTVETDVLFGIVKKAQKIRGDDDYIDDVDDDDVEEDDDDDGRLKDDDDEKEDCGGGKRSRLADVVEAEFKKFKKRKILKTPLKTCIMSATMDVKHFSSYFEDAAVMEIPGRQHHIEILYLLSKLKTDYLEACLETVVKIHLKAPSNEDILVFLTGQEEIEQALRQMKSKMKDFKKGLPGLIPLAFYSSLPPHLQMKVFQTTPLGLRKVVFSTNLAETSLTISGIRYVVDPGKTKNRSYDAVIGLEQLKIEPTSQAQANQRAGRAGRESDGVCYRLYTKEEYNSFQQVPVPEILRRSLSGVILQLVFMGITDVLTFDFIDKPSPQSIQNGVEMLEWLGALKQVDGRLQLTADGRQMAAFPLNPHYSRVILHAKSRQCLNEVLTIISMLSADSIYINSSDDRKRIAEVRESLEESSGDLLMLLNVATTYAKQALKKDWCEENYINPRSMHLATDIKQQLKDLCLRLNFKIQSSRRHDGADVEIRKCFLCGFFMNTARFQIDSYITTSEGRQVTIHPSSCLYSKHNQPDTILFIELVDTNDVYMRNVCSVDFDWLREMAPSSFKIKPMRRPDNKDVKKRNEVKKMERLKDRMLKSMMKKEIKRMKK